MTAGNRGTNLQGGFLSDQQKREKVERIPQEFSHHNSTGAFEIADDLAREGVRLDLTQRPTASVDGSGGANGTGPATGAAREGADRPLSLSDLQAHTFWHLFFGGASTDEVMRRDFVARESVHGWNTKLRHAMREQGFDPSNPQDVVVAAGQLFEKGKLTEAKLARAVESATAPHPATPQLTERKQTLLRLLLDGRNYQQAAADGKPMIPQIVEHLRQLGIFLQRIGTMGSKLVVPTAVIGSGGRPTPPGFTVGEALTP